MMRRLQGKEYHSVKHTLVPVAFMVTNRGNVCMFYDNNTKHYLSDGEKDAFDPTSLPQVLSQEEFEEKHSTLLPLKAWEVTNVDSDGGYGEVIFAHNRQGAIKKSTALSLDHNKYNKRVKRLVFLDGKNNLTEKELKIELIKHGWEFFIHDTLVNSRNLDKAIELGYI